MLKQRWYPGRISDQIPWLINFYTKAPGYETTCNLPPALVDACVASCKFLVYVLSQWLPAVRVFSPSATECLDLLLSGSGPGPVTLTTFTAPPLPQGVASVPPGVLTRLFALVEMIKDAPNYTPAIGEDLGIIAPEAASPTQAGAAHTAPTVKFDVLAGETNQVVRFTFVKHGHQALHAEGKRGTGGWEFLGVQTESPFVDTRPLLVAGQPEIREYRFRFWDKGTPNGEWLVLKVTVGV